MKRRSIRHNGPDGEFLTMEISAEQLEGIESCAAINHVWDQLLSNYPLNSILSTLTYM